MTTLKDLRDRAQHKLMTGDATGALKVFRLVLEGEPLDFTTRLKIADCLLVLGETRLAGACYTAVAVYGIKAGLPLQALVAIKMIERVYPQVTGLQHDLAILYGRESPRIGRGVRAAPVDLDSKVVRDGIDLDYPMDDAHLRTTTAQMAAYLDNITKFPERVPPVPLFSDLGAAAFERVVGALQLRRYDHGEIVVRQGDPGDSFFVVAQGHVRVERRDSHGVGHELATLGEGSILGEMAVLAAEPRSATVTADGGADLLSFTCEALRAMAAELPQVGAVLERFATERSIRNLLNTNPFFKPFDKEQRTQLLSRFEAHRVPKGTVMVRQDEEGRGIYVILHGSARVVRREPDGTDVALADLRAGDCFGEIAVLQERPTTARVAATSDATVMFLPKEHFCRLIEAVPALGAYYLDLGVERLIELKRAVAESVVLAEVDPEASDFFVPL
jgi:cAMP-dependent protein kinase regulator